MSSKNQAVKNILVGLTVVTSIGFALYYFEASDANLSEAIWFAENGKLADLQGDSEIVKRHMEYIENRNGETLEDAVVRLMLAKCVLAYTILGVICGLPTAKVASSKGYGWFNWFYVGFFLSIIGLIAAAGLGKKEPPTGVQS